VAQWQATGKGLNIKGKSAKEGVLSGLVPFLQISEEAHKRRLGVPPPDATIRVFWATAAQRDEAALALEGVMAEMEAAVEASEAAIAADDHTGGMSDDEREGHLHHLTRWRVEDALVERLDANGAQRGVQIPERLFIEAFIMRRDISHSPGWETGRGSEPDYMELNLHSTRHQDPSQPTVVCYQHDEDNPLNPRGLLVAYEESGGVLPVVSDFDAFLIGSKGLTYPEVPREQVPFLHSLLNHVEGILSTPGEKAWTQRWFEVIKGDLSSGASLDPKPNSAGGGKSGGGAGGNGAAAAAASGGTRRSRRQSLAGSFGKKRADGRWGFGDDLSRAFIKHAVAKFGANLNGGVRHAAEAVNYYFPQELDDEFLVVWEGFHASSEDGFWKRMGPEGLKVQVPSQHSKF